MKKIIIAVLFAALCVVGIYIVSRNRPVPQDETNRKSKIIVPKSEYKDTEQGKILVKEAMATLPEEEPDKEYDVIEGKVVGIPPDTSGDVAAKIPALLKDGENIVVTNIPYVNTLRYLYGGREVRLKGSWNKNAVIYGKEYKSFWIEDVELLSRGKEAKKQK